MPVSGEWQTPIQPHSGSVVLPRNTAPSARRRATAGASAAAATSGVVREPLRHGQPSTSMLSLMVAGRPSTRPTGSPFNQRASLARACARAASRLDADESVDRRLEVVDAGECVARDLDRRQRLAPVQVEEIAGSECGDVGWAGHAAGIVADERVHLKLEYSSI